MRRMILQTLVTTCGINAVGLINSIILSRWLGPEGRGDVAAAMLWPGMLVYLCSMGLIVATMYFASLPDSRPGVVLANAVTIGLLFSLLAAIGGFLAVPWLLKSQAPSVIAGSRLYLLVIPISLTAQFGTSVLQGRLRMTELNILRTIIPIGYLAGTVSFIAMGRLTLANILILHLSLSTISLISTFALLAKCGVYPALRIDLPLLKQMLAYGMKVHVGQISGFANVSLDQTLIAAWLPSPYLGLYVVAVSSASLSQVFSAAVQTVSAPGIAGTQSEVERGSVLQKIFRTYWLFSILITLLLGAALPILIPSVFGARFAQAIWPAEILLIGSCFLGAKLVLAGGADALGDPWLSSKANLFALAITVVLLYLLLPVLGITGAAIASAAAYFAELCLVVYGLRRNHAISPGSLFRFRFGDLKSAMTNAFVGLRRNRLDYTAN